MVEGFIQIGHYEALERCKDQLFDLLSTPGLDSSTSVDIIELLRKVAFAMTRKRPIGVVQGDPTSKSVVKPMVPHVDEASLVQVSDKDSGLKSSPLQVEASKVASLDQVDSVVAGIEDQQEDGTTETSEPQPGPEPDEVDHEGEKKKRCSSSRIYRAENQETSNTSLFENPIENQVQAQWTRKPVQASSVLTMSQLKLYTRRAQIRWQVMTQAVVYRLPALF